MTRKKLSIIRIALVESRYADQIIFFSISSEMVVLTTDEKEVAYENTNLGPPTAIVNNATCVKSLMKSTCADTGAPIFFTTKIHISFIVVILERIFHYRKYQSD